MDENLVVMICTPTTGIVRAEYANSLACLIPYYLTNEIEEYKGKPKGIGHMMIQGAKIGSMRDDMVDKTLEGPATHILFIDDDMGFLPDALNLALSRQQPIIVGNYIIKNLKKTFTATDEQYGRIQTTEASTGLEPCTYGGFGFCLIERKVLEALERPRFMGHYDYDFKEYTTEDYPFFKACIEKGFTPMVDHDVSKKLVHVGSFNYKYDFTGQE